MGNERGPVDQRWQTQADTSGHRTVYGHASQVVCQVHVSMPALRLQFPFLWRDRVEGRAKRCARDQPLPLLLNSYRAHMRCITTLAYIDEQKLLLR